MIVFLEIFLTFVLNLVQFVSIGNVWVIEKNEFDVLLVIFAICNASSLKYDAYYNSIRLFLKVDGILLGTKRPSIQLKRARAWVLDSI